MSGSSGSGSALPRPRLVTLAAVTAITGCALLVVDLFGSMGSLRSSDTRESVERFLTTPPGDGLGLGVGQVLDLMHGVVLVSGALAAAGAVLAGWTLRRHRGARIGLGVVAVLMLFTTSFVAGLLPFVVALAASMLWRQEARDWFDGRPSRTHEKAPRPAPSPPSPPPAGSASTGSTPAPWLPPPSPPATAPGQEPDRPPGQAPPAWQPPQGPPVWPSAPVSPRSFGSSTSGVGAATRPADRRPVAVLVAAILTWVSAGLALLLLLVLATSLVTDQGRLISTLQDNPDIAGRAYTADQLFTALWLIAALGIVWALAAAAFAVLAVRGVRAGQVSLVVSAALAGLVGIATVVAPVAAAVTIALLLRRESRAWFAARARR